DEPRDGPRERRPDRVGLPRAVLAHGDAGREDGSGAAPRPRRTRPEKRFQGRADRRRLRRDARRLRHLQGGEDPPLLGAPARLRDAAEAPAPPLPVHEEPAGAAGRLPAGLLPRARYGPRQPVLLPPAALEAHAAAEGLLLR